MTEIAQVGQTNGVPQRQLQIGRARRVGGHAHFGFLKFAISNGLLAQTPTDVDESIIGDDSSKKSEVLLLIASVNHGSAAHRAARAVRCSASEASDLRLNRLARIRHRSGE